MCKWCLIRLVLIVGAKDMNGLSILYFCLFFLTFPFSCCCVSEAKPEEEEDDDMDDEEWKPYVPEDPSPILRGFHGREDDKFWLSMVNKSPSHACMTTTLTHK